MKRTFTSRFKKKYMIYINCVKTIRKSKYNTHVEKMNRRIATRALICAILASDFLIVSVMNKSIINVRSTQSSASPENSFNQEHKDDHDIQPINLEDYPMVVPKRAAVLLDRLMVALHHALEDEDDKPKNINQLQRDASYYVNSAVMSKGDDAAFVDDNLDYDFRPNELLSGSTDTTRKEKDVKVFLLAHCRGETHHRCWEDFYWNCIEERFCFDENIVKYDPEEDEHYLGKHTGMINVHEPVNTIKRDEMRQSNVNVTICNQPTRRNNSSNDGIREVQPQANILAPEILAAFANSQIFNESHPSPRIVSPLPSVHQVNSAAMINSEDLMQCLEGIKTRIRGSSESPTMLRKNIPKIVTEEQNDSSPDLRSLKIVNKNLQLEAPYFSFRPASESDIFTITNSITSRISTTPEVPSVSFTQLPKYYSDTPTVGQYRESKSLYEIQTAGIKEEDYTMPRYYTKSHLIPKSRLAEACVQTPKRVEKSKRLKNIRMQLPPLMIHSSNSSIDRYKEGKRQTRS